MTENASHGNVSGHLVQAGSIRGGVHIYAASAGDPLGSGPGRLDDVSLDPPNLEGPLRDRREIMAELTALLSEPDGVPRVLHGLGGCGKTTVAQALAEQAESQGIPVFWVHPEQMMASMLWVAVELGGSMTDAIHYSGLPQRACRWAWQWLHASPEPWLLVFDSLDHVADIADGGVPGGSRGWIRGSMAGTTLVTSRVGRHDVWRPARMHAVDPLPVTDSVLVLRDHAAVAAQDAETPIPRAAWDLAELLGGVGLALRLVGRLIREHPLAIDGYEGALAHLQVSIHADTPSGAESSTADEQQSLLTRVWDFSVTSFIPEHSHARPLLSILALLGHRGARVPVRRLAAERLAGSIVDIGTEALTAADVDRALMELASRSLIDMSSVNGEPTVGMHPVVAETTRRQFGDQAIAVVAAAFELVHMDEGRDLVMEESAYGAGLEVQSIVLGDDHPDTLRTRHRLAFALVRRGELERAHPEYVAILEARRRVLGEEDGDTVTAHRGLAWLLAEMGDHDSAEAEYRLALRLHAKRNEQQHAGAMRARQGLAWISAQRGELDRARAEFGEVYEMRMRMLGSEHRDTLSTLLALAWIAQRQGDLPEAAALYERILHSREHSLGSTHPDTLRARHATAWIAGRLGARAEAEARLRSVLGDQERLLGDSHPDTVLTRRNLAELGGVGSPD
ncbi:tetratricopeptide repeat protein [Murinocardiopsis flavida]|nr:tetratricopeptide repeat protein [Murinocardiopsis flavida]